MYTVPHRAQTRRSGIIGALNEGNHRNSFVPSGLYYDVGHPSYSSPPVSGRQGDLLQQFEVIEHPPEPQGHARHRVLGHSHGKLNFPFE